MEGEKTGRFEEREASRVTHILEILQQDPDLQFFRGQSNSSWRLLPRLARLFGPSRIPDTWQRLESFILEDFIKYAVPHLPREPKSEFEWLVMGQHYGLPTRLLDWTTNPLKATFFAVSDLKPKRNGALFAFAPTTLLRDLGDNESIRDFERMMPIFPKMIDSRIISQEAAFTVFPFPPEYKRFRPLENTSKHGRSYWSLLKIVIPSESKLQMLTELNTLGVNSRTLFPDLVGLADFVSWKHKYRIST